MDNQTQTPCILIKDPTTGQLRPLFSTKDGKCGVVREGTPKSEPFGGQSAIYTGEDAIKEKDRILREFDLL